MFTISITVFEVLWEALGLPAMPACIAVDQHGATMVERAAVRAAALAQAERSGLGRPPELDRGLAGLLDLLACHHRALGLRELDGTGRRAIAAGRTCRGVLAVTTADQITLTAICGDHLADHLAALLPALPAGPGRACSVRSDGLSAAMNAFTAADTGPARAALRRAGVRGGDAEQLLAIARSTTGRGTIGAFHAAPGGNGRQRLTGSIGYLDTPRGRYLVRQHADPAGECHTAVLPTGAGGLRMQARELLRV